MVPIEAIVKTACVQKARNVGLIIQRFESVANNEQDVGSDKSFMVYL